MLRPYFMRQRELLGDLARLAYETIKELMLEAVGKPHARPGVVVVPPSVQGREDLVRAELATGFECHRVRLHGNARRMGNSIRPRMVCGEI